MDEKEVSLSEYYVVDTTVTKDEDKYIYSVSRNNIYREDINDAAHSTDIEIAKAWLKLVSLISGDPKRYKIVVRETILKDYKGD